MEVVEGANDEVHTLRICRVFLRGEIEAKRDDLLRAIRSTKGHDGGDVHVVEGGDESVGGLALAGGSHDGEKENGVALYKTTLSMGLHAEVGQVRDRLWRSVREVGKVRQGLAGRRGGGVAISRRLRKTELRVSCSSR